jgi:hypothetical protein
MWGANKVYVPYCSSDGWIGDALASSSTWGWHFRGQRIVRETLRDLVSSAKMSVGAEVLFGGFSAGARGMMNLVDMLHADLPADSIIIGAFLDSAYWVDVPSANNGYIGSLNEQKEIYLHFNVSSVIPSSCLTAYPNEPWKCTLGQYRMPFVQTPYILIASQYDTYQIGKYSYSGDLSKMFANHTISNLLLLAHKCQNCYILSWTYANHAVGSWHDFWSLQMPDTALTQKSLVEDLLVTRGATCLSSTGAVATGYRTVFDLGNGVTFEYISSTGRSRALSPTLEPTSSIQPQAPSSLSYSTSSPSSVTTSIFLQPNNQPSMVAPSISGIMPYSPSVSPYVSNSTSLSASFPDMLSTALILGISIVLIVMFFLASLIMGSLITGMVSFTLSNGKVLIPQVSEDNI